MSELTLSDLIALGKLNSRNIKAADITEEDRERYDEARKKVDAMYVTFNDAIEEMKDIHKKTNIWVDPRTVFEMINNLKIYAAEYEKKLYDILIDDVASAYVVIEGQLKDALPGWETEYYLRDFDVELITDDAVWQQYVYENKFDCVRLPGCSSALVPICLRFRKDRTEEEIKRDPWAIEIRFLDVLCLTEGDKVERVQALQCANVSGNLDGVPMKDQDYFKKVILPEIKKRCVDN